MTQQTLKLGKLERVHGISPASLQRALILIILSFIFFLAMLIAFSIRQQIGYFILATAFLIVKLFTLFGWMMQRKKAVLLYENGLVLGKQVCFYRDIENIHLKQTSRMLGGEKIECEIVKTDGEKIVLPEAIHDVHGILDQVEEKLGFNQDEDEYL
jgi:hypothetical protein